MLHTPASVGVSRLCRTIAYRKRQRCANGGGATNACNYNDITTLHILACRCRFNHSERLWPITNKLQLYVNSAAGIGGGT